MTDNNMRALIEALIFASEDPLPPRKIKEVLDDNVTVKDIRTQVEEINQNYQQFGCPLEIIEIAGGYQIVTKKQYAEWIKKLHQSRSQQRLTRKGLEALAIVAYKQPITKQEIEQIRGVNSDGVIRTLIERNLITVKGREKAPGNPLLYGTTNYFLQYFGLNDLSDLPKLKEIDDLLKDDKDFLESLDQVSLQQLKSEELGLKYLEGQPPQEAAEQTDSDENLDNEETNRTNEHDQHDNNHHPDSGNNR